MVYPTTQTSHFWRCAFPFAVASALALILWIALTRIGAASAFTSTTADAVNLCFATTDNGATVFSSEDSEAVRAAVAASVAAANSTVKIAGNCAGTAAQDGLLQTVVVTRALTLAGGYTTTNWLVADPAQITTLDALQGGRVISASAPLMVQDLWIQNGYLAIGGPTGYGAGIHTTQPLTLTRVTVFNNATVGSGGLGGGAYVSSTVYIDGATFISNTSSMGGGGGIFVQESATVTGSSFINNLGGEGGGGAGVRGDAHLIDTTFISNTAIAGGGVAVLGRSTLLRTTFSDNNGFAGGGAYLDAPAVITEGAFLENRAEQAGGAWFGSSADLTSTSFVGNKANSNSGGGAYIHGTANLLKTTFSNNSAGESGGGAYLASTAILSDATFIDNVTVLYGGGVMIMGDAILRGATFIGNSSTNGFAGGAWLQSAAAVTGAVFLNNTASAEGGAIRFTGASSAPIQMVNSLLAGNSSLNNRGDAIHMGGFNSASHLTLLHNTVAHQDVNQGSAIYVRAGSVTLTNTIIASHTIAIERVDGAVIEDYNLFADVATPFSGTVTAGLHSLNGVAAFVDPTNNDYQLTAASDAVDTGTDAGIDIDYFGDPRPLFDGFDMGYDESSVLARFHLTSHQPASHRVGVDVSTNITAAFDMILAPGSVTARTFAVYATFGGLSAETLAVADNKITLNPARALFAGEQVQVIATEKISSTEGAQLTPMQWTFTAGPVKERCVGYFAKMDLNLEAPGVGPVKWGDYDNDGDLDVLVAGNDSNRSLTRVYRNDGAGNFVDSNAALPGINGGTADWVDYDNDGDLDILLTGKAQSDWISRLYRNDGGAFVEAGAADDAFVGLNLSSTAWGDYDNDGDLDLVLSGETSGGSGITRLYRNEQGTFVEISAGLAQVFRSAVAWGDYDNDGDLDLLVSGASDSGQPPSVTRIYRNDRGVFVDSNAGLPGLGSSRAAWGDFDNDGDLDILISGATDSAVVAHVYRNDGGSFVNVNANLAGAIEGQVSWGDYDNDGDLDILSTGTTINGNSFQSVAKRYRNDGGAFTEVSVDFPQVGFVGGAWGDYDNDGDLDILVQSVEDAGNFSFKNAQAALYRNDDCTALYLPNVVRE